MQVQARHLALVLLPLLFCSCFGDVGDIASSSSESATEANDTATTTVNNGIDECRFECRQDIGEELVTVSEVCQGPTGPEPVNGPDLLPEPPAECVFVSDTEEDLPAEEEIASNEQEALINQNVLRAKV